VIEQRVGRLLHHLVGLHDTLVVDELLVERDVHLLDHRRHPDRGDHLLELLDRPGPRRHPAV